MATGLHNSIHLVQTKPLRNLVAPFKSNILEKRLKAEDEAIQQENKHTQEAFFFHGSRSKENVSGRFGSRGTNLFCRPETKHRSFRLGFGENSEKLASYSESCFLGSTPTDYSTSDHTLCLIFAILTKGQAWICCHRDANKAPILESLPATSHVPNNILFMCHLDPKLTDLAS